MKRNFSLKRGFTLIEVLIVVAIVGILTAILVANYNEARKSSRDKIRKSDLKSLQLAIELYKAQNGTYPRAGCGLGEGAWVGPGTHDSWGRTCDEYIAGLVPDYIAALPRDPNQELDHNAGFIYRTAGNYTTYKLLVHNSVESQFVTSSSEEFSRYAPQCGGSTQNNAYGVYSAGAECW